MSKTKTTHITKLIKKFSVVSFQAKPKSPKRDGKLSPNKRTVSYPTMFSTIVEKVEEEEKAGRETAQAPESPLSHFYDSLSLKSRSTWPSFLGDWAFVSGTHKARGGECSFAFHQRQTFEEVWPTDNYMHSLQTFAHPHLF